MLYAKTTEPDDLKSEIIKSFKAKTGVPQSWVLTPQNTLKHKDTQWINEGEFEMTSTASEGGSTKQWLKFTYKPLSTAIKPDQTEVKHILEGRLVELLLNHFGTYFESLFANIK